MTDPATVIVVLVLVLTGLVARAAVVAAKGRLDGSDRSDVGAHVVVGVARPSTALPLARVAAAIARPARGRVEPLSVHPPTVSPGERLLAQQTLDQSVAVVVEEGVACVPRLRIDEALEDGILHTLVEQDASILVVGWPIREGGAGSLPIQSVLAGAPTPIVLARMDGYRWNRIVLRVPQEPIAPGLRASLRCATQVAERVAATMGVDVTPLPRAGVVPAAADQLVVTPVTPDATALWAELETSTPPGDVLLVLCHGAAMTDDPIRSTSAEALYQTAGTSAGTRTRTLHGGGKE